MKQILITGDLAQYNPTFPPAVVTVRPGVLTGSGGGYNIGGKTVCIQGDEKSATVPGCPYISGSFTIPGMGTLSVFRLAPNQLSTKTNVKGKWVMIKGSTYTAKFEVTVPAQMPTPGGPVPDPTAQYMGTGEFITTNATISDQG